MTQKQNWISDFKLIDLTHALDSQVPTWDDSCGFQKSVSADYSASLTKTNFLLHCLEMHAGIGTHMDAPCHCIKGGMSIADIALTQLLLPLIVLDVSSKAHANYQIDVNDILAFEKTDGAIPPECLVIGYTGWSQYWNHPAQYRNADEKGELHFPSFSRHAAEVLLERGVSGIAIDTLSPDLSINGYFPVHELFLGKGKYIIENVANAHLLPSVGAYGIVLPLKVSDCAEAPVRFIALI
ncbi:MAG: cyclase family protein [Chlamydiales bacterium]